MTFSQALRAADWIAGAKPIYHVWGPFSVAIARAFMLTSYDRLSGTPPSASTRATRATTRVASPRAGTIKTAGYDATTSPLRTGTAFDLYGWNILPDELTHRPFLRQCQCRPRSENADAGLKEMSLSEYFVDRGDRHRLRRRHRRMVSGFDRLPTSPKVVHRAMPQDCR